MDPITAISNAIGDVFKTLPVVGIGTKSRINEQNAYTQNQIELLEEVSKNKTKIIVIVFVFLIVLATLYFLLK